MMAVETTKRKELNADYYDKIYSIPYDTGRFQSIYDTILNWAKQEPEPRILEIGCGVGILGSWLYNLCEDRNNSVYHGFDFSETALAKCPEIIQNSIFINNAYNKKVWQTYFNNHDYNIVVAVEVFEHLNDLKVIAMIPKGVTVLFSVPDFDSKPHLRTYPNMKAIAEWYDDVMKIEDFARFSGSEGKVIWICKATKI